MKILDLGCGANKTPGAIGVDLEKLPGVDIVHDLNSFPYPIETSSFDRIIMTHGVEHIDDTIKLMSEINRIGKPGAEVQIATPHFTSLTSYIDPTHRHHFSLFAFDFFCGGTIHEHVPKSRFEMVKRVVRFWPIHDKFNFVPANWLGIRWIAQNHPVFFERFLCFLFPVLEFQVTLRVIK